MTLEGKTKDISIALPSLLSTQEFEPSGLMIKTLCAYLESIRKSTGQVVTPQQIIVELGHDRTNWYNWQKKPLFTKWWSQSCEEFHQKTGLYNVHSAIYRRAIDNSPQDAKMYLDRFDPNYKPATAQEHRFPGIAPPEDIAGAVERSKARAKALTGSQDSREAPQQAAGELNAGQAMPEAGEGQEAIQGRIGQAGEYKEVIEQYRAGVDPHPPFEGSDEDYNTPLTDFSENGVADSNTP